MISKGACRLLTLIVILLRVNIMSQSYILPFMVPNPSQKTVPLCESPAVVVVVGGGGRMYEWRRLYECISHFRPATLAPSVIPFSYTGDIHCFLFINIYTYLGNSFSLATFIHRVTCTQQSIIYI